EDGIRARNVTGVQTCALPISMPAQRRIDLILESVRRLLRMGATPNLLNLLQKQHPADLAQIFAELPQKERHAAFNVLVERNAKRSEERRVGKECRTRMRTPQA